MKKLLTFIFLFGSAAPAQTVTWTDSTSNYSLPAGVTVHYGARVSPLLRAWYIDVDMNNSKLAVRPYLSTAAGGKETIAPFVQRVGAIAGVNGGFFDVAGSTSYSAVVYPGEVMAQNIKTLTRTSGTYTVTRSFFGLSNSRKMSVDWIFHFGPGVGDIYRFAAPTPNTTTTPAPAPAMAGGTKYDSLLVGIGGGPRLVRDGQIDITYDEEVFFGSGVDRTTQNPRTAVGFTASNHAILLVADGRQAASDGVTLDDLAQIMLDLGCTDAMNLDGGGSTQMAVGGTLVDVPSESRAVPTILAVVYADSINFPPVTSYEKIIDTGDSACTLAGGGWFASANSGYWGSTPAQLAPVGNGDKTATFALQLPKSGQYDIFAWWVAANNRSTSTPFVVRHSGGTDTVRMNQTLNGSKWNRIGNWSFAGDSTNAVVITNATTAGSYVVADAIRIVSYDSTASGVEPRAESVSPPAGWSLGANYPNPFNPSTEIRFTIPRVSAVTLSVVDLLGREVAVLLKGSVNAGRHEIRWDASGMPSGVYICQLRSGTTLLTHRMMLLR